MDITIDEFRNMADDRSQMAFKIAMLEQQLQEKTEEVEQLRNKMESLKKDNTKTRLRNMMLMHYITLSAEKIKIFVAHLTGIDRFAFLKTFLEYVLPAEHYQEQLLLVNQVMTLPEEPKQMIGETHNHFEAGSGCQVFNDQVTGQFERS